jgi:hypothetical protein
MGWAHAWVGLGGTDGEVGGGQVVDVFIDTFVPPGLDDVWFATRACPACLDAPLDRVRTVHEPHWLCTSCGRCWRVEHGLLKSVDVLSCRGCATRPKSVCLGMLQSTFPRFGAGAGTDRELP